MSDHKKTFQSAIQQTRIMLGEDIFTDRQVFINAIEDLVPYLEEDTLFLKKIYDDDIGRIIYNYYHTTYDNHIYKEELRVYLSDKLGLNDDKTSKFYNYFFPSDNIHQKHPNDPQIDNIQTVGYNNQSHTNDDVYVTLVKNNEPNTSKHSSNKNHWPKIIIILIIGFLFGLVCAKLATKNQNSTTSNLTTKDIANNATNNTMNYSTNDSVNNATNNAANNAAINSTNSAANNASADNATSNVTAQSVNNSKIADLNSYLESGEVNGEQSTTEPFGKNSKAYASASSELSERNMTHTASRILDGVLSNAWVEGIAGQGIGETVTITFDKTYKIEGFDIYAGYHKSKDLYLKNSRPKELKISFSDGTSEKYELKDIMEKQGIVFSNPHETSFITIEILSVFSGSKYEDTVISEIIIY